MTDTTKAQHPVIAAILKPFRLIWWTLTKISELSIAQIRSLATVAFLAGIIALSAENWGITFAADHAAHEISEGREGGLPMLNFLTERMRYTSGLQAWFAIIIGAVILGAEYVSFKLGQYEASLGKGKDPRGEERAAPQVKQLDRAEDEIDDLRAD